MSFQELLTIYKITPPPKKKLKTVDPATAYSRPLIVFVNAKQ